METAKGIITLLMVLSVLVIVHEWGHYIVAKLFRMRVEEFSLFFGKILVRLGVRDGTEYNIRAWPLGGFVRIAGMEADDISGGRPVLQAIRDHNRSGESEMDRILEQVKSDTMAEIDPGQIGPEMRSMIAASVGPDGLLTEQGRADLMAMTRSPRISTDEHKLIELLLNADSRENDPGLYSKKPVYQRALVIFAGPFMSLFFGYFLFCVMGMTIGLPTDKSTNQIRIAPDGGPARDAGLITGDRIVAINGKPTTDGKAMVEKIHASIGVPITLTIERSGNRLVKSITPKPWKYTDEKGKERIIGRIGVVPIFQFQRQGPISSVVAGTYHSIAYVRALVSMLFSSKIRENVGGPIAMAQMATVSQRLGLAGVIETAAIFSLSLGIMNLLPIPILDGGHLLLLTIEKVRRRKLSPREMYKAQMVGLGLLALIVCFVMYNDIVRTIYGKSIQ